MSGTKFVLGMGISLAFAACAEPPVPTSQSSESVNVTFPEVLWSSDETHCIVINNIREDDHGEAPFYLIAPIDPDHPQDPEGNDCVVRLPGDRGFSAKTEVMLVLPGAEADSSNLATRFLPVYGLDLAYAADLGDGWVNLTSTETIETAAALGLVEIVPAGASLTINHRPTAECTGADHED